MFQPPEPNADALVGAVSHELNTTLTAVLGNAHVLRTRGEDMTLEARTGALSDLESHAQRLFAAIQNLLLLARLEIGEQVYLEPVLLPHLLDDLIRQAQARNLPQPIVPHIGELDPVEVDRNHFRVLFNNVLENAFIYSPASEPIEISARQNDDHVEIAVCDGGQGVAVPEYDAVFLPFYRSSTITDTIPGLGIGLTVARRLAELHGGSLRVAPKDEYGKSAFVISLPALQI